MAVWNSHDVIYFNLRFFNNGYFMVLFFTNQITFSYKLDSETLPRFFMIVNL